MGYTSSNIFFLPVVNLLLRTLACPASHSGWMDAAFACDSAERVSLAVVSMLALVVFIALTFAVTLTFVDRDPCSTSWDARTTGRVDVVLLALKLLVAFLFNVLDDGTIGQALLAVLLLAAAVVWVGLYLVRAPFAHPHMQALATGFGGFFFVASLCFLLAVVAGQHDPTFLLYIGAPLGFGLGFAASLFWQMSIAATPLQELRDLHQIFMWARSRLRRYAELGVHSHTRRSRTREAGFRTRGLGFGSSDASALGDGTSRLGSSIVVGGPEEPVLTSASDEDEDEAQLDELLAEAEAAYQYGMESFPRDEVAFVVASSFFRFHAPSHFQEATALSRARRCNPSFDTTFYIFQRTHQLRDADTTGISNVDRMTFEQNLAEIHRLRVEAYRHLVLVWETLSHRTPDLSQLRSVGLEFQKTIKAIDGLFQTLMRGGGESIAVLRSYASFLIDLANEPSRATELLARADRIEEVHSKQRTRNLRHIVYGALMPMQDAIDERSAVVTLNGDANSLGEILNVSASVCRLFGYTSAQLVGQSFSILKPPPIRGHHNELVQFFGSAKRRGHLANPTVLVFGQSKAGPIFPMLLQILEAPPEEETCVPRFMAVIQPIASDEDHILFGPAESGFRLYAASQRSLMFLGLDAESLAEENLSMLQWFPSLAPTFTTQRVVLSADDVERMQLIPSMAETLAGWMGVGHRGRSHARPHRNSAAPAGQEDATASTRPHAPRRRSGVLLDEDGEPPLDSPASRPQPVPSIGQRRPFRGGHNSTDESESIHSREGEPFSPGGATPSVRIHPSARTSSRTAPTERSRTEAVMEGRLAPLPIPVSGAGPVTEPTGPQEVIITVGPLLHSKKSMVIPVAGVDDESDIVVGSVQEVALAPGERCFVLRWHSLDTFITKGSVAGTRSMARAGWGAATRHALTQPLVPASSRASARGSDAASTSGASLAVQHRRGSLEGPVVADDVGARRRRDGTTLVATSSAEVENGVESSDGDEANAAEARHRRRRERHERREARRRRRAERHRQRGESSPKALTKEDAPETEDQMAIATFLADVGDENDETHATPTASRPSSLPLRSRVESDASAISSARSATSASRREEVRRSSRSAEGADSSQGPARRPSSDARATGMRLPDLTSRGSSNAAAVPEGPGSLSPGPESGASLRSRKTAARSLGTLTAESSESRMNTSGPSAGTRNARGSVVAMHAAFFAAKSLRKSLGARGSTRMNVEAGAERDPEGGAASSVGSSTTKLGVQLRRAIGAQDTRSEQEVRWSRMVLLGISVFVILMLISLSLWATVLREVVVHGAESLFFATLRLIVFQSCTIHLRALSAHNEGFFVLPNITETADLFKEDVQHFHEVHELVFSYSSDPNSPSHEFDMDVPQRVFEVIMGEDLLNHTYRVGLGLGPPLPNATFAMALTEFGQYISSILLSIGSLPPEEIRRSNRDVANFLINRQGMRNALNASIQLRQAEFVEEFPAIQTQILAAGIFSFLMLVVVSGFLFVTAVRSMGDRTGRVLRLFLIVPESLARAMKQHVSFLLNKALAADALGHGEEGSEAGDDEDEMRLAVQEDGGPILSEETEEQRLMAALQSAARQQLGGAAVARRSEDRSHFVLVSVVKLLIPILALTGWVAFLVLFLADVNARARDTAQRMTKLQESHSILVDYVDTVWRVLEVERVPERAELVARARERDRQILAQMKLVIFGGTTVTSTGVHVDLDALSSADAGHELVFGDACAGSPFALCADVADGVLAKGLYSAVMAELALGRKVLSMVPDPDSDSDGVLANPENVADLERSLTLLFPHLEWSFDEATAAMQAEGQALFDDGVSLVMSVSIVFVVCFIVFSALFYLPVISNLAVPLQSARSLLTVLPDDMILFLPSLRRSVQAIVVESQLGTHSGYRSTRRHDEDEEEEEEEEGEGKGARKSSGSCCARQGRRCRAPCANRVRAVEERLDD